MKLIHISDTHGKHQLLKDLPDADVIVHAGDITEDGTEEEVKDFIEWFSGLPYVHKIFIAGNHDNCLYVWCQYRRLARRCALSVQ